MTRPCSICGSHEFVEFGGRSGARCVTCDALERQRALAHVLVPLTLHGGGKRCLEAGPLNRRVFGEELCARGWGYTSIDRSRQGNPIDRRNVSFVDHEADLADLGHFADATFDLFLAQHVLEEVDDYTAALGEIARVLGPGGIALIDVPYRDGQTEGKEPDRFGKVWSFGADLLDTVRGVFGRLEVVPLREGSYRGPLLVAVKA